MQQDVVHVHLFVWHRGGKSWSMILIERMNKSTSFRLKFCEVLISFK